MHQRRLLDQFRPGAAAVVWKLGVVARLLPGALRDLLCWRPVPTQHEHGAVCA